MENIILSLGKKIYENNNHFGYLIDYKLIAPLCNKWSRNRDSDNNRVNEIYKYYKNNGYIPHMIHLAELKDECLVCYDGNHRREVFNKLIEENINIICIIDIIYNATQSDIHKAFDNINKSIQLPAIYLDNNDSQLHIKNQLITLVKKYEINYKPFLSASYRCHVPNFNRDKFTDNLYDIYTYFNGTIDINYIEQLLIELNNQYANENLCKSHNSYKTHIITKCKKYNFWLFIDKYLHIEHIKILLQKENIIIH